MMVMAMMIGSVAFAVEPNSTEIIVPELTGRAVILSQASNISEQEKFKITTALEELEAKSNVEMIVLIVDSIEPFAIEEYSMKVAEEWKIGKEKEDNGIILVVAVKDRKTRIEVGYGMEGVVTDAMSKRIISDYMIPRFKENRWTDGVIEAIGRIGNLANNKPLDAQLDQAYETEPVANKSSSSNSSLNTSSFKNMDGEAIIFVLILMAILALFTTGAGKLILIGIIIGGLVSFFRNNVGSLVSGVVGGIASGVAGFILVDGWWIVSVIVGAFCGAFGIAWLWHVLEILLHIAASSRGSSSSGSSSSGGGGYSGGGGRFGGGGSSGSW